MCDAMIFFALAKAKHQNERSELSLLRKTNPHTLTLGQPTNSSYFKHDPICRLG